MTYQSTEEEDIMDAILKEVRAMPIEVYDEWENAPTTQKEAEARVWQCLLWKVAGLSVEDEIGWDGLKWNEAQRRRWQKAEINVCKQIQTKIKAKAQRISKPAPNLFGE